MPNVGRKDHEAALGQLRPLMQQAAGIRRLGSAAMDLAWVASGRLDGYWDRGLSAWDIAAGILIVQESGGIVSGASGGGDMLDTGSIVAGNEVIHALWSPRWVIPRGRNDDRRHFDVSLPSQITLRLRTGEARGNHVLGFRRRQREYDPYKLASPQVYLWRMTIFLIIAAFVALILYSQVLNAYRANPGLNSVIIAVLVIGIGLSFRQIFRLFPEIRWVNTFRVAEPGVEADRPPVLLAPMATLLGDRIGRMAISTATMRSILDSIQMRLDEDRDMGRYLTSLLIFLGCSAPSGGCSTRWRRSPTPSSRSTFPRPTPGSSSKT